MVQPSFRPPLSSFSSSYGTAVTADELGLPTQPEKTTLFALDGNVIRVETGTRKVLDVYTLD